MLTVRKEFSLEALYEQFSSKIMAQSPFCLLDANRDWIWEAAHDSVDVHTEGFEDCISEAMEEREQEIYNKVEQAFISALDYALKNFGMWIAVEGGVYSFCSDDWEKSARKMMDTINGHGMFYFDSLDRFISAGPWQNAEDATVAHIHWIESYGDVYGNDDLKRLYSRNLEDVFRYA